MANRIQSPHARGDCREEEASCGTPLTLKSDVCP